MKPVEGSDGRSWTIQSTINWSPPATEEQFEHDMAAGYVSGIAMFGVVGALVLFVLFWTPDGVFMVPWLMLLFPLLLMLGLMQWAWRRPWTIVAETRPEQVDTAAERWVGTVQGMMAARQQTRQIVQNLKSPKAVPDDGSGPLREVK